MASSFLLVNKEDGLKSSYDYIISAVDDFLTNRIQALKHWYKKCVNFRGLYAEK